MADFNRLDQAITSVQDVIDAIHGFLTATGPGPSWTEDATYTKAANLGELFLETSAGTDNLYVYFNGNNAYSGNTVVQCYYVSGTGNGFGGAAGPTAHHSAAGAFLHLNTTKYTYTMDLFADEDRCVVVLKAAPLVTVPGTSPPDPQVTYQTLYFGRMNSHAGGVDDPYPNVVLGNSLYLVDTPPTDAEYGFFPETLAKQIGPNDLIFGRLVGKGWNPLFDASFRPPRNSRGSEAFSYATDIHIRYPGADESFSLIGVVLTTPDVGIDQDVSVGGTTHFSIPSMLNVVGQLDSTVPPVYLVVKGTAI